jgi:hypothetical protein
VGGRRETQREREMGETRKWESGKVEGVIVRGTLFKGEGAEKFSCFEGS